MSFREATVKPLGWLLLGVLLLAGCSPMRACEAWRVLARIGRGAAATGEAAGLVTRRRQVALATAGGVLSGDLYLPVRRVRAGVVMLPGVAEQGLDDPRLVAFATVLAQARFAVLVPELSGLRRLRVSPRNIGEVRDAFQWLANRPDLAPGGRAGLVAFSYAVGPAVLAALEKSVRDRVRFIFAVGGYHDLYRVLTYLTTGYFCHGGQQRYLAPDDDGKWAFLLSNLDRVSDAGDRALLEALARRCQRDARAGTAHLTARLGDEGRVLWAFVTNADPARVPALLEALPLAVRRDVAGLNPAGRDLSRLRARLILVHGYGDRMIPFTESIALAKALPARQVRLYLVHGLAHVDVAPGLPDRWRLWRAVAALLAARDGAL
jgi:hypothetical protein